MEIAAGRNVPASDLFVTSASLIRLAGEITSRKGHPTSEDDLEERPQPTLFCSDALVALSTV